MERNAVVCLAGTLDTKGAEYAYVKECLLAAGVDVFVVDCGVLGEPFFAPDLDAAYVAEKAGIDLADFQSGVEGAGGRVLAVTKMSEGLQVVLDELVERTASTPSSDSAAPAGPTCSAGRSRTSTWGSRS